MSNTLLDKYDQYITIKSTGLDIEHGMSIEQWLEVGDQLKRIETGIQWWIGDWINYGEKEYGEKYSQALDSTDYTRGSLRNISYVANKIELSRRRDNVSFSQHAELAKLEPEDFDGAIKEVADKQLSIVDTRRLAKKIQRSKTITVEQNKLDIRLGDFREADIKNNSIDFIVSDLPYPVEYIDLFGDLAEKAAKWLKPGGFIAFYSGEINLQEVFAQIKGLEYYWTFCLYHEGQTQLVHPRNVICRWKPILIFQKPPFRKLEDTRQDYLISKQPEKSGHDWQQSESGVEGLIEAFSQEGDTVLDPTCGTGTFVRVAHRMNRNAIGYEIDETTYKVAKSV